MLRSAGGVALGTPGSKLDSRRPPFEIYSIAHLGNLFRNGLQYQAANNSADYALKVYRGFDRFEVRNGDTHSPDPTTSERSEVNSYTRYPFNQDIWLSFGQRIHRSAPTLDNQDGAHGWIVMGQIWATPDTGEYPRSPVVVFQVLHNVFQIATRSSTDAIDTTNLLAVERFSDPNFAFDAWHNWVLRARFNKTANGLLQVWRDGTQIVNELDIPIGYNDDLGHRFQFGVYRANDSSQATVIADYANVETGTSSLSARIASPLPIIE